MMYSYKSMNDIPLPLTIKIRGNGQLDIQSSKIIRYLPKRRIVCLGMYKGENVIIKIFFGKGYKKRWERELAGVNLISETGIKTPNILEQFLDENHAVIIFQYISEAETLDEKWKKSKDEKVKQKVFSQSTDLLAIMHDAGVFQRDIHLSNFISKGNSIYLIDGEQVYKKTRKNQLVKAAEQNLSMFFTQMFQYELPYIRKLFTRYLESRNEKSWLPTYDGTMRQLQRDRKWRIRKYIDSKVFRNCTEFEVLVDKTKSVFIKRNIDTEEVRRFIDNLGPYIDKGEVMKNGTSTQVIKIKIGDSFFILKCYKNKGFTHSLFSKLKKHSRSTSSWRYGHLLKFIGISTPEPVLCMDKKLWTMGGYSFLVTEFLHGTQLQKYLLNAEVSEKLKKTVACKVKEKVKQMHESNITHGDLKLPNIMIVSDEPFFIDLDSMCNATEEKIKRDIERFNKSISEMEVEYYFVKNS